MNICFAECLVELFNERKIKELAYPLIRDTQGYDGLTIWNSLLERNAQVLVESVLDDYDNKGYDVCFFLQAMMVKLSQELNLLKGMRGKRCRYQFQNTFASIKDGSYQYLVDSHDLVRADVILARCLFVLNQQQENMFINGDYYLVGSIYYNTDLQHYFYVKGQHMSNPNDLRRMDVFIESSWSRFNP
ncbi:BA75_00351T0 [Komagataella pastoris]|uniref:BA75_00351T0 n=1 Tax=Komagataella pastoris TaxID=4922 RepID=A0A1B2J8A3_PICPA|nr:BA75_00351T0 [Komagataella pastoris]